MEQFPNRPYPSEEEKLEAIRKRANKDEKKKPEMSPEEELAAIRERMKGEKGIEKHDHYLD